MKNSALFTIFYYYKEYYQIKEKYIKDINKLTDIELQKGVRVIEKMCIKNSKIINKVLFSFKKDNIVIELENINRLFKFISVEKTNIHSNKIFNTYEANKSIIYEPYVSQNILLSENKYFYSVEIYNSLANIWQTKISELQEITSEELFEQKKIALNVFFRYLPEIIFAIQK